MVKLASVFTVEGSTEVRHAAPLRPKKIGKRRLNMLLLLTGVDEAERERLLARLQKVK